MIVAEIALYVVVVALVALLVPFAFPLLDAYGGYCEWVWREVFGK